MPTDAPTLSAWNIARQREPTLRVGLVLADDHASEIRVTIQADDYVLAADSGTSSHISAGAIVHIRPTGAELVATSNDLHISGTRLRLHNPVPTPLIDRPGVIVHDVVAGRGFHWQKRVNQHVPGVVEFQLCAGAVVVINELPLEHYLAGVITAEMGADCPLELLKAQCVVARSWLLARSEPKHVDEPFDRCNDDCCQRYQGTGALSPAALEAVQYTRGLVLLTEAGDVLDANYSKSCGGVSEEPRFVWGQDKAGLSAIVDAPVGAAEQRFMPVNETLLDEYLDGAWLNRTQVYCSPNVADPNDFKRYLGRVDEPGEYFRWTVSYERDELVELLRRKLPAADTLKDVSALEIVERGVSGRISRLVVHWRDARGTAHQTPLDSEYRIRAVLSDKFLYSSAFAVRCERTADGMISRLTLRGAGWGHGVGLCQIGALGMALAGHDCAEICRHYYPLAHSTTVY